MVKVTVPPVLGTILLGRGGELKKFNKLPAITSDAIIMEAYQRLYLNELFGQSSKWEGVCSMENEILPSEIGLVSKDKTPVIVTEKVSVIKFLGAPSLEAREKKINQPRATAKLAFTFVPAKGQLLVEVKRVSVREASTKEAYSNSLDKAVKAAGVNMERKFNLTKLIKSFFDTLHIHGLCYISGNEALNMRKVFSNAKMAYPNFARISYGDQIAILHDGFERARTASFSNRDIHTLAKGTFEAMYEKGGIIDEVFKHDFNTNKMMTYLKVAERKKNQGDTTLLFVDYKYGTAGVRTTLSAFDLWDVLAKGVRASDASF